MTAKFSPPPVEHAKWFIMGQPDGLTHEVKWAMPDFISETHFPTPPFESVELIEGAGFPGGPASRFQDCLHFSTELNLKPEVLRLDFGRVVDFIKDVGAWWDYRKVKVEEHTHLQYGILKFAAKVGPLGRRTRRFTEPIEAALKKHVPSPSIQERFAIKGILDRKSLWGLGDDHSVQEKHCSYEGPFESHMDWKREMKSLRSALFLLELSRDELQCAEKVRVDDGMLRIEAAKTGREARAEGYFEGEVFGSISLEEFCSKRGYGSEAAADLLRLSAEEARAAVELMLRKTIDAMLADQLHFELPFKKVLPKTLAGSLWMLMNYYQSGGLKLYQCDHCGKSFHVLGRQANARNRLREDKEEDERSLLAGKKYCPRWLSPACYRTSYERKRRLEARRKEAQRTAGRKTNG